MSEDAVDDDLPVTNAAVALARYGERPHEPTPPSQVIFGALISVAAIAALLIFLPAAWLGPTKYSAWATAMQAFGTVMAFAGTTAAFVWQWRRERDLGALAVGAERRSQAVRVHGWLATENPDTVMDDVPPFVAVVENRSDAPVYKVLVEVVDGRRAGEPVLTPVMSEHTGSADLVPPQSRVRMTLTNFGGALGWRPALQVSFTDASGQHWIRHSFGPLVELQKPAWAQKGADMGWSWAGILSSDRIESL
jgi:hypothetical protein